MKMLKTLLTLSLLCACTLAAAQWQWLDKDGRKVYSDRAPPPDITEKNILKRPSGSTAAVVINTDDGTAASAAATGSPIKAATGAKGQGSGVDKELEAKKKQAEDAEAAKKKAEEDRITKAKIENCARAKQAKTGLDSGIRISRINTAGEREVMDEAARAAEAKRIQGIMATDCQ